MTDPPALPRRTVLKHAGLAAAALAGLSACTSYGPGGGAPPASASGGAVTATKREIPVGGGKVFPGLQAVITQPSEGEFKAFSSICTHQRCPVADVTDTINCNCHGSRFSIADGSVVKDPATEPLPTRALTVDGDNLTVV